MTKATYAGVGRDAGFILSRAFTVKSVSIDRQWEKSRSNAQSRVTIISLGVPVTEHTLLYGQSVRIVRYKLRRKRGYEQRPCLSA